MPLHLTGSRVRWEGDKGRRAPICNTATLPVIASTIINLLVTEDIVRARMRLLFPLLVALLCSQGVNAEHHGNLLTPGVSRRVAIANCTRGCEYCVTASTLSWRRVSLDPDRTVTVATVYETYFEELGSTIRSTKSVDTSIDAAWVTPVTNDQGTRIVTSAGPLL